MGREVAVAVINGRLALKAQLGRWMVTADIARL
jgi:hypothetical protein